MKEEINLLKSIYTDEQVERIFELMQIVIDNATGGYADYAKTYAITFTLSFYDFL